MYFFTQSLNSVIFFKELFERDHLKCSSFKPFSKAVIADKIVKSGTPIDFSLKQVIKALSDSFFFLMLSHQINNSLLRLMATSNVRDEFSSKLLE